MMQNNTTLKPMEKIETPVNRLRWIFNESGSISDIDWQEAIEAEQIEMMTAVDLFVNYRRFTEDAFKTWYAENYQEKFTALRQPPVSGQSEQFICPCCGSNKTYKTDAIHCNRCAVTTEI